MSYAIKMPQCTSCQKRIFPRDVSTTKFYCPNCGETEILRCGRCKKFGRQYQCIKCGFIGP